jgi:hypothetical protein
VLAPAVESRQGLTVRGRCTAWLFGIFAAATMVAQGCGPSAQAIYEGNVRFEHCYRLDLDKQIAPSHRSICWREWMSTYSYGQTSDRVEHARQRIKAIEAGETSPPDLDLDGGEAGVTAAPAEAPMPTNANAPPPATAPASTAHDAGASLTDASVSPLVERPRAECQHRCDVRFDECVPVCRTNAGPKTSACTACEREYLNCMRRCFR